MPRSSDAPAAGAQTSAAAGEPRKSMAKELGYTGSTDDSATMNIWLHKEVVRQVATTAEGCRPVC